MTKKTKTEKSSGDLTRIDDLPPMDHPLNPPELPDLEDGKTPTLPHQPPSFLTEVELENDPPPNILDNYNDHEIIPPLHHEDVQVLENVSPPFEINEVILPHRENFQDQKEVEFNNDSEIEDKIDEEIIAEDFVVADFSHQQKEIKQVEQIENQQSQGQMESYAKLPEFAHELKEELETLTSKNVPIENYPSFTLLIEGIERETDKDYILQTLKENSILQKDFEIEILLRSLSNGHLLLPRLSEFTLVFMANKLRFLPVKMSLFDSDIYSKNPILDEKINKGSLKTNQALKSKEEGGDQDEFLATQLDLINGRSIEKSFEPITETELIESYCADEIQNINHQIFSNLKEKAIKLGANAILKMNWQVLREDKAENRTTILLTGQPVCLRKEILPPLSTI